MNKVKPGSITETFGFSRALHLMQYAGEKVRNTDYSLGKYLIIVDEKFVGYVEGEFWDLGEDDYYLYDRFIDPEFIMGSWEIWREELHDL